MGRSVAVEAAAVLGTTFLLVITGEMIANAAPEVATHSPPAPHAVPDCFRFEAPGVTVHRQIGELSPPDPCRSAPR